MDYFKIGERIRKMRRAHDISQEVLAEMVDVSTTHMSHIETGNTKLSLPVLVDLAQALNVRADDLLSDNDAIAPSHYTDEIADILERCNEAEAQVLCDIVKAAKLSMDKHL